MPQPLTHTSTFRVRHYECDAHGTLRYASYLNYMQEAAFDGTAAAGYDLPRYEAMGRHWLVRETQVEYAGRPLRYGDEVEVTTYVVDFRRVRSRRAYELRLAGSGQEVARAFTDWVFLDTATGRPASIPPEIIAAFFPQGPPEDAPPRDRFPASPPPPPDPFRLRRTVRWEDVDPAGHVNNAVYLAYLEDCTVRFLAESGGQGRSVPARRQRIEYLRPGLLGDQLDVTAWPSDEEPDGGMFHYTVTRAADGELLARARVEWGDFLIPNQDTCYAGFGSHPSRHTSLGGVMSPGTGPTSPIPPQN